MNELSGKRKPLLLAHRGTSLLAPENTAPAFDFAMTHGVDVLEIDVRLSRDCQAMVFHDATLERTTNGSGLVRDLSAANLKRLDAAYHFEPNQQWPMRGQGIQILTLSELLERYPDVHVNIDIKDADKEAVVEVGQALQLMEAKNRCVLASFHGQQVVRCRQLFPDIKCGMSATEITRYYFRFVTGQLRGDQHVAGLFQVPTSYFYLPLSGRRFIGSIHQGGGEINFWTINDPEQMKRLLVRGADGIVTDRADLARKVFAEFV